MNTFENEYMSNTKIETLSKQKIVKYKGSFTMGKYEGSGELYYKNCIVKFVGNFKGGRLNGKKCQVFKSSGAL